MDRRIAYVVIAFVAPLLFFVAIGYDGWGCGGSILGPLCRQVKEFEIIGALILTAALLIVIAAIVLILHILMGNIWTKIVSAIITTIAAILAIAGTFYYLHFIALWSPFIATIAMTLVIVLAALILTDLITSDN
ncbi:unnamed protein product [Taenia asiatica]|uniref:Expressed conserved protein n=1 Tax=Taenia asiatica TaxID=60517 RepID=A0A0R3VYU1_TAEAS|nr:unnamed protein product [Taenia asiatica]